MPESGREISEDTINHLVTIYTDLVVLGSEVTPLLDIITIQRDIKKIVRFDTNYHPTLIEYLKQFIGKKKEPGEFKMTFQETSELVSILPPRAPKELLVVLKRDVEQRLLVVYQGEIDVANTAGRKE